MDDKPPAEEFLVEIASEKHIQFTQLICRTMEESARIRGTGIARRSPLTIANYILDGKAIIATHLDGRWAGFCYLTTWQNGTFVSNSGLIVAPEFRQGGLARRLKKTLFDLCRKQYPSAILVGITTSLAVMKINTDLGFSPTTFAELPQESAFWAGCQSCVNHDILLRTGRKYCLCTAMRFVPAKGRKRLHTQHGTFESTYPSLKQHP